MILNGRSPVEKISPEGGKQILYRGARHNLRFPGPERADNPRIRSKQRSIFVLD